MVPDPMNGQAWNRYSYVVNNPLAFTDPSGYCFLGLCGVGNFFTNIGKDIRSFLQRVPIVGTILEVAAAAICPAVLVCAVTAAFLSTTAVSGIESGSLKLGLKAGLIAAATAVAFWEVGNLTMPNGAAAMTPMQRIENIAGHALVGCGQAVASGGKCGPSALAGAVTSAAGPMINGYGFASVVANAALGGGAAVLGGGKFENGAITGAFGYLFNWLGHDDDQPESCMDISSGVNLCNPQNVRLASQVASGSVGFFGAIFGGIAALGARVGILITEGGLGIVADHLAQFGEWAPNRAMLDRLWAQVGTRVTGADANFYTHEMLEAQYMAEGMTYDAAHGAALENAGVSPFSVYHPEVIQQFPSAFNNNWRAFWGIR
jgi:hypothetical protein